MIPDNYTIVKDELRLYIDIAAGESNAVQHISHRKVTSHSYKFKHQIAPSALTHMETQCNANTARKIVALVSRTVHMAHAHVPPFQAKPSCCCTLLQQRSWPVRDR